VGVLNFPGNVSRVVEILKTGKCRGRIAVYREVFVVGIRSDVFDGFENGKSFSCIYGAFVGEFPLDLVIFINDGHSDMTFYKRCVGVYMCMRFYEGETFPKQVLVCFRACCFLRKCVKIKIDIHCEEPVRA